MQTNDSPVFIPTSTIRTILERDVIHLETAAALVAATMIAAAQSQHYSSVSFFGERLDALQCRLAGLYLEQAYAASDEAYARKRIYTALDFDPHVNLFQKLSVQTAPCLFLLSGERSFVFGIYHSLKLSLSKEPRFVEHFTTFLEQVRAEYLQNNTK